MKTSPVPRATAGPAQVLLGLLIAALLVQGILRLWVAGNLVLASRIEGQLGGFVHWRIFDQFAGWVALLILAMADAGVGRMRVVVRWVIAAGLVGLLVSLMMGEVGGRAMVELAVAGLLALAGVLVAVRQVVGLAGVGANASRGGVTVEQLWRGIAVQWLLLWVAAEVTLRIRFRKEGIEAEELARTMLFLLPVVGVSVNVMMAMGIRWWGLLREPAATGAVRVRAWVVAMLFVNVGAMLVIAGAVWARGVGVAGAGTMIVGIALYMIGFPRGAWRRAGKLVPAAFGVLVLGLVLMGVELLAERHTMPELYSAGWRHLLASVEVLWLAGMGGLALRRLVPERVAAGARGPALAAGWMLLMGTLATAGTFLLGISAHDLVRGLLIGAGLQLFGIVTGAVVALRAGKAIAK